MNLKLFISQINSMTAVTYPIPKLSLQNDFSFVSNCFVKAGKNLKDSINEQTASFSKKYTTLTR